jgi:hypothetical protein
MWRNTPWSVQETQELIKQVNEAKSWDDINIEGRSRKSCQDKARALERNNFEVPEKSRQRWTEKEEEQIVYQYRACCGNWNMIDRQGRSLESCQTKINKLRKKGANIPPPTLGKWQNLHWETKPK